MNTDFPPKPGKPLSIGTVLISRPRKNDNSTAIVLVIVDGEQFATGEVTPYSCAHNAWRDGHYFSIDDFETAHKDFLARIAGV